MPTVGSLFSGVGGFDLGLEQAGWRILWQCEVDPFRQRVLAYHWPKVQRFDDIQTVDNPPTVDLICGGFPCQDLSQAGARAGLSGSRSGLFWECARIIEEIRPTWVLLENVPGLLSSNRGDDFASVLRALEERGYGWAYRILDSQYFGVAQRRRRVYIVAHASGRTDYPASILFEPEGGSGSPSKGQTKNEIVATLRASTYNAGRHGWRGLYYETYIPEGAKVRHLTAIECERLQGFPDDWTNVADADIGPRCAALGDAVTVPVIRWLGGRMLLNQVMEHAD